LKNALILPTSCNYAAISGASGSCLLKYTGGTKLINKWDASGNVADPAAAVKVDFHGAMSRCAGGTSQAPFVGSMGISGAWASSIREMMPCTSNFECTSKFGAGVTCYDMGTTKPFDTATLPYKWMYTTGSAYATTCASNLIFKRVMRRAILSLVGKAGDGSAALKFCVPNYDSAETAIKANVKDADGMKAFYPPVDANKKGVEAVLGPNGKATIPMLVEDVAGSIHYPGEQTTNQRKVSSSATFGGYTVESFDNVAQAAFRKAIAQSLSANPATADIDADDIEITTIGAPSRRILAASGGSVNVDYSITTPSAAAASGAAAIVSSPSTGIASPAFQQALFSNKLALTPPLEIVPIVSANCGNSAVPCTANVNASNLVVASNVQLAAQQPIAAVFTMAPTPIIPNPAAVTARPTPKATFKPTADPQDASATLPPTPMTSAPTAAPTKPVPANQKVKVVNKPVVISTISPNTPKKEVEDMQPENSSGTPLAPMKFAGVLVLLATAAVAQFQL
jgi:hypothetical protein